MAPWEEFDIAFAFKRDFSYDHKLVDQIISNRRVLDHVLFVDRLLKILGIEAGKTFLGLKLESMSKANVYGVASKIYPPRSNQSLRSLFQQIVSSSSPNHHKQSLIYYILKDCRGATEKSGALQFARTCYLPDKYRLFIDGLWYLDKLEFRRALEYITEPSLIPTFSDEILYVLSASSKQDDGLAIAYYVTVQPPLASQKALNAYFGSLCRTGVPEAFYFLRQQPEESSSSLLEQLITFVLSTKAGELRAKRAMDLINLPFSETEEECFNDLLLRGNAKNLHGARDTVMMRRVATGRVENLDSELESLGGRRLEGLNWDDLKRNLKSTNSVEA
ncbi:uncharacterized protein ARB_02528 [Trichophyton benhamiae CBS 112371]|uniref:ELYS-like domain-containing protein n=1 Tax=Arthroderma benhamiae (strain ATCC MYA-4681 / CBS 112371) TaxID=663331 RepID=D4B245_ARTBC|nr:uncharacterized protein ARB_02528 [Trichophyton benhamiae CBS 112371]EFE30606.1 hypothetical protein ARB_02528 [Trichophyton benhamiae CBS 112371]